MIAVLMEQQLASLAQQENSMQRLYFMEHCSEDNIDMLKELQAELVELNTKF